jgi:tRNA threonylcarbamoyladenosine biosynthesis protein TsaE
MMAWGEQLIHTMSPGAIVYLEGALGAGNTTLVRAYLRARGYTGLVKSPTYTWVEEYEFEDIRVCHLDLYRLSHPRAARTLGIEDYVEEQAVLLIEWPSAGLGYLPQATHRIQIEILPVGRSITYAY